MTLLRQRHLLGGVAVVEVERVALQPDEGAVPALEVAEEAGACLPADVGVVLTDEPVAEREVVVGPTPEQHLLGREGGFFSGVGAADDGESNHGCGSGSLAM